MPATISFGVLDSALAPRSVSASAFEYGVYGISIHSEFPLALPGKSGSALASIELRTATPKEFANAIAGVELQGRTHWYKYVNLADGSSYVRWSGLGEFLVHPEGREILCAQAPGASRESYQVYLLGQALSFAIVKLGFEPLHGTAIVINGEGARGEAIVLLGDTGFGKSTLAASFIDAGYPLLTDDLLLLHPGERGLNAYPGPSRIKLFPKSARQLLGAAAAGVPMNPETRKQIISLRSAQTHPNPVRLRAIYVLAPPQEMRRQRRVRIEPLPAREAFVALLTNTFNYLIADRDRLRRQVQQTTQFLDAVPVKKLSYPRLFRRLPEVREAILADSRNAGGSLT